LNKYGRGPSDYATYQISKDWVSQFQRKRFLKNFPLNTDKPLGRAIFGLGVIMLAILVEDYKVMLHTIYQRSGPLSFREEDF